MRIKNTYDSSTTFSQTFINTKEKIRITLDLVTTLHADRDKSEGIVKNQIILRREPDTDRTDKVLPFTYQSMTIASCVQETYDKFCEWADKEDWEKIYIYFKDRKEYTVYDDR